jgi:hypothetical protein
VNTSCSSRPTQATGKANVRLVKSFGTGHELLSWSHRMSADTLLKLLTASVGGIPALYLLVRVVRGWTHHDPLDPLIIGEVVSDGQLKFLHVITQFKNNSLRTLLIQDEGSALLLYSFVANQDSQVAQADSWRRLGAYSMFKDHPRNLKRKRRNWGTPIIRLVPREVIKDERLIAVGSELSDREDQLISIPSGCAFFKIEVTLQYRKFELGAGYRNFMERRRELGVFYTIKKLVYRQSFLSHQLSWHQWAGLNSRTRRRKHDVLGRLRSSIDLP